MHSIQATWAVFAVAWLCASGVLFPGLAAGAESRQKITFVGVFQGGRALPRTEAAVQKRLEALDYEVLRPRPTDGTPCQDGACLVSVNLSAGTRLAVTVRLIRAELGCVGTVWVGAEDNTPPVEREVPCRANSEDSEFDEVIADSVGASLVQAKAPAAPSDATAGNANEQHESPLSTNQNNLIVIPGVDLLKSAKIKKGPTSKNQWTLAALIGGSLLATSVSIGIGAGIALRPILTVRVVSGSTQH